MATLTNTKIKDTYDGLLKTTDNDVIGTTEKVITDGLGNASILSIGTQSASFSEDIKINGQTFGVGAGNISSNVAIGFDALEVNTTGSFNVAIGNAAALSNTTGARNIAIGFNLLGNTTGNDNISLGFNSLYYLTGSNNIAIGRAAGIYSTGTLNKTAGDQNVYIGANIVSGAQDTDNEIIIGYGTTGNGSNTATYGNTFITDHYFDGNVRADFFYGDGSNLTNLPAGATPTLQQVTTAGATTTDSITVGGLTASGLSYPSTDGNAGEVLATNGSGTLSFISVSSGGSSLDDVLAAGNESTREAIVSAVTVKGGTTNAGMKMWQGNGGLPANLGIGYNTLSFVTTGTNNTVIGGDSGLVISSGGQNVALGNGSLSSLTTSSRNVAIGYNSLFYINGNDNVAVGQTAGTYYYDGVTLGNKTSGTQNIYIGTGVRSAASNTTNEMVFGYGATGNGSNTATYGNNSITDHIFPSGDVGIKGNALLAAGLGYAGDTTSAGAGKIELYDTSTGALIIDGFGAGYLPNSGIQFQVAGSEKMRIDSSGRVLINGATSGTALSIRTLGGMDALIRHEVSANPTGYYTLFGTNYSFNKSFVINNKGSEIMTYSDNTAFGLGLDGGAGNLIRFSTNGSERMRITSAGGVCINRTSGSGQFNVDGSVYLYNFTASAGTRAVRYNDTTGLLSFDSSSARYKDNIRETKYGLSDVLKIESKTFEYKDTNRTDIGFIAEQVYEVIPELVILNNQNQPDGVSYDRITSVLVKAIQEQQEIINDLKARIETLEAK